MSTISHLKKEIINLKKELLNEKIRYDQLYKATLGISRDFMQYTERNPNRDSDDDAFNLIKINFNDIESFDFK